MSLRLISFLILLGTMPVCSVYAQCEGHTFDNNGFCTCGSLTCTLYQPATLNINGTEDDLTDDYYEISNAGNLYWFANHVNSGDTDANAKLTADIIVNGNVLVDGELNSDQNIVDDFREWTPMGYYNSDDDNLHYVGTFDGGNHTISGLYVNNSQNCVGLFGSTSAYASGSTLVYASVQNVGVIDSYFKANSYVGTIVGHMTYGNVSNCYNTGVCIGNSYVGGIVGVKSHGQITNCYNTGTIESGYSSGGIAGSFLNGEITYCFNYGNITTRENSMEGAIVGYATHGKASNCYYLAGTTNNGIGGDNASQDGTASKTSAEFASGEVAYLLQYLQETQVWGQNIDNDASLQNRQYYPVLSDARVYTATCCGNDAYSNKNTTYIAHAFADGFCKRCDAYQPAEIQDDGVYQIFNAGNLYWFAALVNGTLTGVDQNKSANAKLMSNIVVNEKVLNENGELNGDGSNFREWTPMGYYIPQNNQNYYYSGTFEGNDKTISGLYCSQDGTQPYVGLFSYIASASVQDLGVIDSYFEANNNASGIVGYLGSQAIVSNCYNIGTVSVEFSNAGGIAVNNYGTVQNCYNAGLVKAGYEGIGGIVSFNEGAVSNCYNIGGVSGPNFIGSIVGQNQGTISDCYNTGSVNSNGSDQNFVGGIVGNNTDNATISNCYYLAGTTNNGIGGDNASQDGTASKTSAEFASGEVAWLLQNAQTSQEPTVWGQNIDNGEERQNYPVLSTARVYTTNCCGNAAYSNTENATYEEHSFDNGFCIRCDAYQAATQEDGVYQIANAGNLYWFANHVNSSTEKNNTSSANAKLTADITVNQNVLNDDGTPNANASTFREWTPIGYCETHDNNTNVHSYTGTFDGNNKTISGLYFVDSDQNAQYNHLGLFGHFGTATVKNLGVIDSYFYNRTGLVGGIVGDNINGNVTYCYFQGTIINANGSAGGVVGNNKGTVSSCYNMALVSADYEGGDTDLAYLGGVVGYNYGTGNVLNCYNAGSITGEGTSYSGGIVGNNTATISNCYNSGLVTYNDNIEFHAEGGIAGNNSSGNVSNCYFLTSSATEGIGIVGTNSNINNTTSKDIEKFKSGEVAYLLQASQTTQVWGQNIDNEESVQNKQDYPVFSNARVYRNGSDNYTYTNIFAWSYENGILTIDGIGPMPDYTEEQDKPWEEYLNNINTVVIKSGVTHIGNNAFNDVNANANTEILIYGTTAPTLGDNCFNTSANVKVYIPNLSDWSTFSVEGIQIIKMPTYTSTGWQMPTTAKSTKLSSTDHVAINADMSINSNETSLSVKSFGYCSDDIVITINDGGQLTCTNAFDKVTVTKSITGHKTTTNSNGVSLTSGWYSIALPFATMSVEASGLAAVAENDEYELFRYDEPNAYWRNEKNSSENGFNTIELGRGYLYARKIDATLTNTGYINTKSVEYTLTANGTTLSGFHLIGNPFTRNITFNNLSVSEGVELAAGYYVLSNQGSWNTYLENDDEIKPGQGILIKTTAEGTLIISPTEPADETEGEKSRAKSQEPMLALNVTNGNYSDRAFVIFGKGIALDKINHQNEEIPVLYIPMSDADYAIAMMDESVNEIPVGFESSSMGEFTISLRQENCEFEELYLLDKETGAKVNILEQDYTFMATSGDNPDRFILVKSQGSQPEAQSNFAYINNGDVVIYGAEGNAQIDIYDVLGRRVYNNNGSDDVHIVTTDGYSASVYIVRLMDDKGVRTQKVIID